MVKTEKIIELTKCDFCDREAKTKCTICGLDLCDVHTLSLFSEECDAPPGYYFISNGRTTLVENFCPNHLSWTIHELSRSKLEELEKNA